MPYSLGCKRTASSRTGLRSRRLATIGCLLVMVLADASVAEGQNQVVGIVERLDLGRGLLCLRENENTRCYRVHPADVASLQPGARIQARVQMFSSTPWLDLAPTQWLPDPPPSLPPAREITTLSGRVTAMNPAQGIFVIGDKPVRFHPTDLDEALLGMWVTTTTYTFAGNVWGVTIEPVGAAASGDRAGIGAQDQVPRGFSGTASGGVESGDRAFARPSLPMRGFQPDTLADDLGPVGARSFPPHPRETESASPREDTETRR